MIRRALSRYFIIFLKRGQIYGLGEVIIRVSFLANESESVRIRFVVEDTGIGIDQSRQEAIFVDLLKRTCRLRVSTALGLGLAICKELIR